jgi:calmodulin
VFDRNGDGYISKAEFKHCMMHFGEQFTDDEVEEMISDADSNNDGRIDYTEFSQMILRDRIDRCRLDEDINLTYRVIIKS